MSNRVFHGLEQLPIRLNRFCPALARRSLRRGATAAVESPLVSDARSRRQTGPVWSFVALIATVTALSATLAARAEPPGDPAVASEEDGRYYDADGNPTYKIQDDGTIDWLTYSGFRRYHSECHVCHGPEGLGSSYAPALVDTMKTMDYATYLEIVASGRQVVTGSKQSVMPAFGTNVNVMCYVEDIYVYLRARADGKLDRGRPSKRENKSEAIGTTENECLGRS